jgi:hypothetical protein
MRVTSNRTSQSNSTLSGGKQSTSIHLGRQTPSCYELRTIQVRLQKTDDPALRSFDIDTPVCGPREFCMGHARDSWQEACAAALGESDPVRLLGLIETTMTALQSRYAEWGSDPATPAELTSILNALSALQRLMNETVARYEEASQPIVGAQLTHHPSLPLVKVLLPTPKNLPST